jgi:hypothetical protein
MNHADLLAAVLAPNLAIVSLWLVLEIFQTLPFFSAFSLVFHVRCRSSSRTKRKEIRPSLDRELRQKGKSQGYGKRVESIGNCCHKPRNCAAQISLDIRSMETSVHVDDYFKCRTISDNFEALVESFRAIMR